MPGRRTLPILLCLAIAAPASADILEVSQDGEGYPTIAAALAAMSADDVVSVHPGVYFEHDLVMPVRGQLVSFNGDPSTTIVDAGGLGRCLTIAGGGMPLPEVIGLQFRNGVHPTQGGLVSVEVVSRLTGCEFLDGSAPLGGGVFQGIGNNAFFVDCRFEGNTATTGGALYGKVELIGCEFRGNTASGSGGGAVAGSGSCISCRFVDNHAPAGSGGAVFSVYWSAEDSRFIGNTAAAAGALRIREDDVVVDCVFLENHATGRGGAVLTSESLEDGTLFLRSVFARNSAGEGGAVALVNNAVGILRQCTFSANSALAGAHVFGSGSFTVASIERCILAFSDGDAGSGSMTFTSTTGCNDVFGNVPGDGGLSVLVTQNGGFAADPLFCDMATDDYRVSADSPCLLPGPTGCGRVGALDVGCGATSVAPTTWARIKSGYR